MLFHFLIFQKRCKHEGKPSQAVYSREESLRELRGISLHFTEQHFILPTKGMRRKRNASRCQMVKSNKATLKGKP
jgi:hypothetical protein